jgi:hypothetical protein
VIRIDDKGTKEEAINKFIGQAKILTGVDFKDI